ncbi:MAG TPA: helix-turn-helix transcriptional regulator, partial [Streptosporangiaceae bacterium]|nr:helix-turn-helix transcriptional regulator [Streptosporangiaceae bacterium]
MGGRCLWFPGRESVEKVAKAEGRGTFAELLRRHRLAAGLTQEALADRAGLSVRGIADLERGARRYP